MKTRRPTTEPLPFPTRRAPVLRVELDPDELNIDEFAGGGGASTGFEMATGKSPDIAVNHDPQALAMHAANHPKTKHLCASVWDVDPKKVCGGRKVGNAWFSPDCTFHSKARGGKPHRDRNLARRRRGLAWVVIRWAEAVRPRVIYLENVEEFADWGPLAKDGRPDPKKKGQTFARWRRRLEKLGYVVEMRELRACDYGAPTIRKRLFIVARCDGHAIAWPEPTHGPGRAEPHRAAAECIDWSIACPSIFGRKRPLAENTLRRIARGLKRYVLESAEPFIVPVTHPNDARVHGIGEPVRTITGANRGEFALVDATIAPFLTEHANASNQRNMRADEPLRTICANVKGGHFGVVAPVLVRHYGGDRGDAAGRTGTVEAPFGTVTTQDHHALVAATLVETGNGEREGQAPRVRDIRQPAWTVTAQGSQGGVVEARLEKAAFLAKHFGGHEATGSDLHDPISTVTARDHHGLVEVDVAELAAGLTPEQLAGATRVYAFLIKFYGNEKEGADIRKPLGTITTKDRFGLVVVTIRGSTYVVVDIGMRMLRARELFNAQGFPATYRIDVELPPGGKKKRLTATDQVHMCGNSVAPQVAAALIRANAGRRDRVRRAA